MPPGLLPEAAFLGDTDLEAKWTELPGPGDQVNLRFAREVIGPAKVKAATVVCRAAHGFPLEEGCRAAPVTEWA